MSQILDFFADNPEVAGSIAKTVPAIMGMHQANKAKNAIEGPGGYQEKLENLERNRQELVNPYATISNPYANLQVATKAAEMQAEQSDIALANTLDTLRQTGAGGATALAQAALKSKQGVSASIQQQETQNQKLQAQGQLQVDIAKGKGESWRTSMQERREIQELDRMQGQADLLKAQQLYSTQAAVAGLGAMGETLGGGMLPPQIPGDTSSAGSIQTLNLAGGDYAVTPSDFGIGGGGDGMLINPMMQFAVQPNASTLKYTGNWSDIASDVDLVKAGGDIDGSAQARINEWYSKKKK